MTEKEYIETLLFAFVWNRGVAPIGHHLGKSDDEIADMVLNTIDAAKEQIDINLMLDRMRRAKERRKDKEKMERPKYSCSNCLNHSTPLCDCCTEIRSPSGETSKPTYYQSAEGNPNEYSAAAEISAKIVLRLTTGAPVPLAWVVKYNEIITSSNN